MPDNAQEQAIEIYNNHCLPVVMRAVGEWDPDTAIVAEIRSKTMLLWDRRHTRAAFLRPMTTRCDFDDRGLSSSTGTGRRKRTKRQPLVRPARTVRSWCRHEESLDIRIRSAVFRQDQAISQFCRIAWFIFTRQWRSESHGHRRSC
mgnify:CR=1 FL=1